MAVIEAIQSGPRRNWDLKQKLRVEKQKSSTTIIYLFNKFQCRQRGIFVNWKRSKALLINYSNDNLNNSCVYVTKRDLSSRNFNSFVNEYKMLIGMTSISSMILMMLLTIPLVLSKSLLKKCPLKNYKLKWLTVYSSDYTKYCSDNENQEEIKQDFPQKFYIFI